jgi:glycosyltransferase involved in cell wall biosynthesis
MIITYIHQYFNTPAMTGSTRSYEFARRFVQAGHQVHMITSCRDTGDGQGCRVTVEDGITVHWLPVPYSNFMSYRDRILAFLRFAWSASREAARIDADVVFATSTPLTIAIPAIYASWRRAVPMVFEVRDLWPEMPIAVGALRNPVLKWLAKRLELFAYRNASLIVALSPGMRSGILANGYPAGRVMVVPNCSDLDRFHPDAVARGRFRAQHGIPQDAVLMTYAGTFGKINGVAYFVRLAERLRDDARIHFLTVGDGAEFSEVARLAETIGVRDRNLTMLPKVPKAQMFEVLAATDIAISTVIPLKELEANSANKVFDGMAAGCCIAINHGGWQADLLSSSGAGFQLSFDMDEAASQLRSWLDAPERIAAAKRAARKLAEEDFSRDRLAAELEQALLKTAGSAAR